MSRVWGLAAGLALVTAPAVAEEVIPVPGFGDFIAVDGATVWLTNRGRVEHWSRQGLLASVAMPHPCGAMAVAEGALWVADCAAGDVDRIDLASGAIVAAVHSGVGNPRGELNVVAGAGSVWVTSEAKGVIARIDPAGNRVVATVKVDPDAFYLAYGLGALWAVSGTKGTIEKIDPASNRVVARTALGKEPGFLVAGEGAVWVQEQGDGTLARVDAGSGAVSGRVKVGASLKWGDIDAAGGQVWLRTTDDQVFAAVDPASLKVTARVGAPAGSGGLRATADGIWTTAHDHHTLTWWPLPLAVKP